MRISDIIRETSDVDEALQSFDTVGDMSQQDQAFPRKQAQWATSPGQQVKIQKFFEKTPYNFRIFVSNVKPSNLYNGPIDQKTAALFLGAEAAEKVFSNTKNAITVIYVGNNSGASEGTRPLTPWIMAHRFGHMMQGDKRLGGWLPPVYYKASDYLDKQVTKILVDCYGITTTKIGLFSPEVIDREYNYPISYRELLYNAIGTMGSARTGQSVDNEFRHELFAQYIQSGAITFNPLPEKLGNKTLKPNAPDYLTQTATTLTKLFEKILGGCVGRVFMMTDVTGGLPRLK